MEYKLLSNELDELVQLYRQNDWPFHGSNTVTEEIIRKSCKCFTNAGFVKEGYLRNAWENADGTISDTVLYGAIKEDWQHKCITPIKMDELPF